MVGGVSSSDVSIIRMIIAFIIMITILITAIITTIAEKPWASPGRSGDPDLGKAVS